MNREERRHLAAMLKVLAEELSHIVKLLDRAEEGRVAARVLVARRNLEDACIRLLEAQ